MSRPVQSFQLAMVVVISLISYVGCQPAAEKAKPVTEEGHDHEGHDHAKPKTYAEAVSLLVHMRDEIKEAFEAGKPESAHDALHDVGHTLESLVALARKDAISAGDKIEEAKEALFDGFGKLDNRLHKKGDTEWSDVEASIDTAIEELKKHLPAGAEVTPDAADHDHEGVDHDHDHEVENK